MAARSRRVEISADRVLLELGRLGYSRLDDYVTMEGGNLTYEDWVNLNDDQLAAIKEVSDGGEKGGVTLKMHNKEGPLDKLARHLGMYDADLSQRPTVPFFQIIQAADYIPEVLDATGRPVADGGEPGPAQIPSGSGSDSPGNGLPVSFGEAPTAGGADYTPLPPVSDD